MLDSLDHKFDWKLSIREYIIVFYCWHRFKLNSKRQITQREKLHVIEMFVWFHILLYLVLAIVGPIVIYIDDPQLWLVFGLPE
jgi:hypothetical protein